MSVIVPQQPPKILGVKYCSNFIISLARLTLSDDFKTLQLSNSSGDNGEVFACIPQKLISYQLSLIE